MNAHDRLERQLRESVEMRGAGHRSSRSPRRRPRLLTVLPVAVTLAVVAVVVVALASGSSRQTVTATPGRSGAPGIGPKPPNPGPAPKNVDQSFLASVENSIGGRDRACAIRIFNQKPSPDNGTPSAEMLSVLPALTRLPPVSVATVNSTLRGGGLLAGEGIFTRYVRLARSVDGLNYYLIPVARAGVPPTPVSTADRCYAATVAALQARITELPRGERAPTLRYGRANLAVERYDSETTSVHEGVLLDALNRGGDGGGGGGLTPRQIERSGQLSWLEGSGGVRRIDGIVPGGVARVRLVFPSRQFTGKVVNDVFVIHLPKGMGRLAEMVWLSPSGQTIRTIDERSLHA